MRPINSTLMQKFLQAVLKKMKGDWVVVGGTVLPLMGIDHRFTVDIDIVSTNENADMQDSIQLMEVAEALGMPVDAINQAAAYFLRKALNYRQHLILLAESNDCRVFRPDLFLYVQLKIARLSESDLTDIEKYIVVSHDRGEVNDLVKCIQLVQKKLAGEKRKLKKDRLREVLKHLNAVAT